MRPASPVVNSNQENAAFPWAASFRTSALSSSTAIGGALATPRNGVCSAWLLHTTLSRPEVHNAINDEMIAGISDTSTISAHHHHILCARSICAALESRFALEVTFRMKRCYLSTEENERDALGLSRMLNKLATLPCATIALVQAMHSAAA